MKYRIFVLSVMALLLSAIAYGQSPQPPSDQPPPPPGQGEDPSDHVRAHRVHHMEMHSMPFGAPMGGIPMGKWWKNAELVQKLQISDTQLQQLEQVFQESRLHLIDLHAALEKQEALLEPLTEADNPDESQVYAQIDKVASARAELEKAHTRMLLNIRKILTTDQWKKLQSYQPPFGPFPRMHSPEMQPELPAPPPPGRPSPPQP